MKTNYNIARILYPSLAMAAVSILAPGLHAQLYVNAVQASAPYADYRLNEASGTTAADSNFDSGTAYDGTYINGVALGTAGPRPSSTPASFGGLESGNTGVTFDGTNDYVSLGGLGNFGSSLTTNNGFSFVLWVNTTSTASGSLIGLRNGAGSNQNLVFQINRSSSDAQSTNALRLYVRDQANHQLAGGVNAPVTSITDGAWHMLAVSVTTTGTPSINFYIDGASAGATTMNFTNALVPANLGNFSVGALGTSFGAGPGFTPSGFYNGSMDEVGIYDRVLSSGDISSLYSAALAVPEPSSFGLIGASLAALVLIRRKKMPS